MVKTGVRYSIDGVNWGEQYSEGVVSQIKLKNLRAGTTYTAYAYYYDGKDEIKSEPETFTTRTVERYFTIANESEGSVRFTLTKTGTPVSRDLQYSLDNGTTWTDFDLRLNNQVITIEQGSAIQMRSSTGFSKDNYNYFSIQVDGAHSVSGNIATLIDYGDLENVTEIPDYGFYAMFYYDTELKKVDINWNNVKAIGKSGCASMFSNCIYLEGTTDPFRSVDAVGNLACESMFAKCGLLQHNFDLSNITSVGEQAFQAFALGCVHIDRMTAPNIDRWDETDFFNWLKDVADNGIMFKTDSLEIPFPSYSGIPTGWDVVPYNYLRLENNHNGDNVITFTGTNNTDSLFYSKNGTDWYRINIYNQTVNITLYEGEYMLLRGNLAHQDSTHKVIITAENNFSAAGQIKSLFNAWSGDLQVIPDYGCYNLFYGASTLVSADIDLSGITEIGVCSFYFMFGNCSKLNVVPDLSSISTVGASGMQGMFCGCDSLTVTPDLANITTAGARAFWAMFAECEYLEKVKSFPTVSVINEYMFVNMFEDCPSLVDVAGFGNFEAIMGYGCNYMFQNCTSLVTPPDMSNITSVGNMGCYGMFWGCSSLTSSPDLSNITTAGEGAFNTMFYGCTSLITAGALPSISNAEYSAMFENCTSLVTPPDMSMVTYIKNGSCKEMFKGCTSLATPPDMSNVEMIEGGSQEWSGGCHSMFYGCTSLTAGADLSACTSVGGNGCKLMYNGCTSLSEATAPNIDTWDVSKFNGWLNDVSQNGTFYKPTNLTVPTNTSSGVPSGWTVVNY